MRPCHAVRAMSQEIRNPGSEEDGRDPDPAAHVTYCRGCRLAWIEPSEYEPGCCACECTDVNDPLYEDWAVDPDPASIPPDAWGERMPQ